MTPLCKFLEGLDNNDVTELLYIYSRMPTPLERIESYLYDILLSIESFKSSFSENPKPLNLEDFKLPSRKEILTHSFSALRKKFLDQKYESQVADLEASAMMHIEGDTNGRHIPT